MTDLPVPLPSSPEVEMFTRRHLPFPPSRVFAAWTDAGQLARWWGPNGFRNTFERFEPCAGGEWQFVMHGPNGADYPNTSVFRVVSPERIELAHVCPPRFDLVMTLAPDGDGTEVTFLQRFASAELKQSVAAVVGPANEQNLDRLTAVLAGSPVP